MITVGFAGLSHLGLTSAVAAVTRGFDVVGYDVDADLVARLAKGQPHVVEPELPELMREHGPRLEFTSNPAGLGRCDLVYIAIDVPTNDAGLSDLAPVRGLIDTALGHVRADAVLTVLCQVPPGFTRQIARDPERLFYQVETLVFGRAMERALHPERFIVGCADPAKPLDPRLQEFLAAFGCPILPMRYESAELAKISINICLMASVSVANTLAEICERIGADWSEIVPSLRLDKRIGPASYLTPGLGFSGGNLERDLTTVLQFASEHDTDSSVPAAFLANSRHRKEWAWRTLQEHILSSNPGAAIAVLGLAYKENTHSTKNAPSLALLAHLQGCAVRVFDPVVPASAAGENVTGAASSLAAAQDADAVCIMTPWPQFRDIDPAALKHRMRGRMVLDPYRLLDARRVTAAGLDYFALGVPPVVGIAPC